MGQHDVQETNEINAHPLELQGLRMNFQAGQTPEIEYSLSEQAQEEINAHSLKLQGLKVNFEAGQTPEIEAQFIREPAEAEVEAHFIGRCC